MAESEELEGRPAGRRRKPAAQDPEEGVYGISPAPSRSPRPERRIHRDDEDDWEEEDWRTSDGGISTIIPYTNPKALIAYYLGIFGLIPGLGTILGPAALVLGILGLRYLKVRPGAKGMGHAIVGIVFGSLAILCNLAVIMFVALVAAGAIPWN